MIPLKRLVTKIKVKFDLSTEMIPEVRCKLFEDNSGAVELSNFPTVRRKHNAYQYKISPFLVNQGSKDWKRRSVSRYLYKKLKKWIYGR
jgi:hypothetical protein